MKKILVVLLVLMALAGASPAMACSGTPGDPCPTYMVVGGK